MKYGLRVLMYVSILLLVVWIGIWAYIRFNKADLIAKISSGVTDKTKAETTIGDLSANLFQTFPFISIELSDVVVKDSLWKIHKRTFFSAKNIYLRLSPLGIFNKNRGIGKVIVTTGRLHLFIDSTYFNNQYILKSDDKGTAKQSFSLPDIHLKTSELIIENPSRQKYHHFNLRDLSINASNVEDLQRFRIKTDMLVNSLAFNTQKGSYLKNKNVRGKFQIIIDRAKKQLSFSDISLLIDNRKFNLTGNFSVDTSKRDFNLSIRSNNLDFTKTIELLPDSMSRKIKAYSMQKPIKVQINISGETRYKFIPLVKIEADVSNNSITTPGGTLTNCNFVAKFNNELKTGDPRLDFNSVLELIDFSGEFEKIPIRSKLIKVSNLGSPYLECDIHSSFPLTSLNELTESSTLQFLQGTGTIDIAFKGPVSGRDSVNAGIDGIISIDNATIKYLPRNFTLSRCTGNLLFREKDLFVEKFSARTGETDLQMNGNAKNFLSLLDISPEKLTLRWNVYSPKLHLKDFTRFLARRSIKTSQKQLIIISGARPEK